MKRLQNGTRNLTLESLEARQLLAGDVAVAVLDGQLQVHGDAADNHIVITAGRQPGQYVVAGRPTGVGESTTVNGSTDPLVVDGVRSHLRVGMDMGDDIVRLQGARFRHSARVNLGPGNDLVTLGAPSDPNTTGDSAAAGVAIRGNLVVDTAEGNDTVIAERLHVGRTYRIDTGLGEDIVRLGTLRDNNTNAGTDGRYGNRAAVTIGGALNIRSGPQTDHVLVRGTHVRHAVHVATGGGDDEVILERVGAAGVAIGTGAGADVVTFRQVRTTWSSLQTGEDADRVALVDSAFAALHVALGSGDDGLAIGNTRVSGFAVLNGGEGADDLSFRGGNRIHRLVINGFEDIDRPDEVNAAELIASSELVGL